MTFKDRETAGRALAARLHGHALPAPIVLALPRGGVPVAVPIAQALGAALDLLLVRKLGAPGQPELAIGAVVEGDPPQTVLNDGLLAELGVSQGYIAETRQRALQEIERRRRLLTGADRKPPVLSGRSVLIVDDGVATGATAEAALRAVRSGGAGRILLTVPVIAADVASRFRHALGIEVVALEEPRHLVTVGGHYRDFHQLEDAEVLALLARVQPAANPSPDSRSI